ncbi:interleukin-20-like [Erpetoichthys calabaricus]|uniref:interleukin-20-like n=1 Tax=Erpetoichthys calabaricus TaxID=27687 RepID=UPI0022345C1C|nr:interleukin-20-like [Erpetoichthys calabaricus]
MAWKAHFGNCEVSIHIHELRDYFNEIRHTINDDDRNLKVQILKDHILLKVKPSESCCFLRHTLRFYVEKVFSHYTASNSQIRRRASGLANSFLTIKRDLRQCHALQLCSCDDGSRTRLEEIHSTYEMLDVKVAAVKAIGELDFLLDWIEGHQYN